MAVSICNDCGKRSDQFPGLVVFLLVCPVCSGSKLQKPKCEECVGSGRKEDKTCCGICGGTGLQNDSTVLEDCWGCGGSGSSHQEGQTLCENEVHSNVMSTIARVEPEQS